MTMLLSLAPLLLAAAQDHPGYGGYEEVEYPELVPGQPAKVAIGPLTEGYPTWKIDVPPGTTSMRLWTTGATDDLSLHLSSEFPTEPGYADLTGPEVWLDEELLVTVNDSYPLYPGEWFLTVGEGSASRDPDGYRNLRADLHLEFPEPARATLVPGEVLELEVTMDQALRAVLTLPEDFEPERRSTWQVELYGPDIDADLLIGPANPTQTLDYPYGTSSSTIGYERATFRGRQAEGLVVHAFGLPEFDPVDRAKLTLRLTEVRDDAPALPSLLPPVELPTFGEDARSRALAGTVAIFGNLGSGTGTILSENGLVVTNAHVVLARQADLTPGATPDEDRPLYYAGFSTDPRLAARPSVSMQLIDYQEDLDLALLAITGTLDDRPLPDDLVLPVPEHGSTADLRLGDPLWALGYPMTGGAYNLTTITLSQGILSGFTTPGEGGELKTDAAIHAGISGGALLDEAWRLVGIPASSITDANYSGGLGFAIPIEALPPEWLELAAREDLGPLLDDLASGAESEEGLALGPYLPLEATWGGHGGLDRLDWVLLCEKVARLVEGSPSPGLIQSILDHEQAAFPALLNELITIDPTTEEGSRRGRLLNELLNRITHSSYLGWNLEVYEDGAPSAYASTENSFTVKWQLDRWIRAKNDPHTWIEIAGLDRPEHQAERRRFAALLAHRR